MIAQGLPVPKRLQSSVFSLQTIYLSRYKKIPLPAAAAAPADEAPPQERRFSRLDFRCAVE
jgi:hypothetical protein